MRVGRFIGLGVKGLLAVLIGIGASGGVVFNLDMEPTSVSSNDNFSAATAVPSGGSYWYTYVDLTGNTLEAGEQASCPISAGPYPSSAWYRFATTGQSVSVSGGVQCLRFYGPGPSGAGGQVVADQQYGEAGCDEWSCWDPWVYSGGLTPGATYYLQVLGAPGVGLEFLASGTFSNSAAVTTTVPPTTMIPPSTTTTTSVPPSEDELPPGTADDLRDCIDGSRPVGDPCSALYARRFSSGSNGYGRWYLYSAGNVPLNQGNNYTAVALAYTAGGVPATPGRMCLYTGPYAYTTILTAAEVDEEYGYPYAGVTYYVAVGNPFYMWRPIGTAACDVANDPGPPGGGGGGTTTTIPGGGTTTTMPGGGTTTIPGGGTTTIPGGGTTTIPGGGTTTTTSPGDGGGGGGGGGADCEVSDIGVLPSSWVLALVSRIKCLAILLFKPSAVPESAKATFDSMQTKAPIGIGYAAVFGPSEFVGGAKATAGGPHDGSGADPCTGDISTMTDLKRSACRAFVTFLPLETAVDPVWMSVFRTCITVWLLVALARGFYALVVQQLK